MTKVSRLFGYRRQNYYKRVLYKQEHSLQQEAVLAGVLKQRARMPRLGTRKLHHLLAGEGLHYGRDRLFGLLGSHKLLIRPLRRYVQTTDSKHWLKKHGNLVRGLSATCPDRIWVSDITYIRTDEGYMYLSLVTDRFSRKIVGYDLSESLRTEGALNALKMAVDNRVDKAGQLIHHSDRGLQYCSSDYQRLLRESNIIPSMTEKYDPYENALAERMNGILKNEFLLADGFATKSLALMAIRESIEIYNNERPHLSLGMEVPCEWYKWKDPNTLVEVL